MLWVLGQESLIFATITLVKLFIKRVIAGDNSDLALILIEFDGVLDQVEEYLLEDGPISADPCWNIIALNDLHSQGLLFK